MAAVSLLLQMLRSSGARHDVRFNQYAQSSQCNHVLDSSVSYASALVTEAASCKTKMA